MLPNGSPNSAPSRFYNAAVTNTKIEVFPGKANLYAFEVENNSTSASVYIQIFNKLATNVTLGTTVPDMTFRIPASSNFGKDAQDYALMYCDIGVTIAVTSTRTGLTAPETAATVNIWYAPGVN